MDVLTSDNSAVKQLVVHPARMAAEHRQLAASVAQAVQERFASLPKTGKNQPHEHTVLAGIVAYVDPQTQPTDSSNPVNSSSSHSPCTPRMHVIAMGTGTKCLGGSKRSSAGDVINDSHAEVVTRRAFVAWVYRQLILAAQQQQQNVQEKAEQEPPQAQQATSIAPHDASCSPAFHWCHSSCKFRLHDGVKFAMYVSQPPCGDASIYGPEAACLQDSQQQAGSAVAQQQQQQEAAAGRTGAKLIRLSGAADVGEAAAALATPDGAAPQQQEEQQQGCVACIPCASDVEAGPQQLGALRRKPGKGDPTLSLSCSDKIARWACLGLQGCLLSSCLAQPLHLQCLAVSVPDNAAGCAANGALAAVEAAAASGGKGAADTKGVAEQTLSSAAAGASGVTAAPSIASSEPQSLGTDGGTVKQQVRQQQQQQQQSPAAIMQAVEAAGKRAVSGRLAGCAPLLQQPLGLHPPKVVAVPPPDSKLGLSPDDNRKSPSGVSINWSCALPLLTALAKPPAKPSTAAAAGVHEVTLAAYGRRAGAGRKGPNWDSKKTRSRLCSAAMYEQWQVLLTAVPELQQGFPAAEAVDAASESYHGARTEGGVQQGQAADMDVSVYRAEKRRVGRQYQQTWAELRQPPSLFAGWIMKP